jgi:5'-3' exonuclease
MHVWFDGDILKYRCGFAAEKGQYTVTFPAKSGDEVSKTVTYKKEVDEILEKVKPVWHTIEFTRIAEPVENALYNVKNTIKKVLDELEPDGFTVVLSGPTNFRNSIATIKGYKANRDSAHRPVHGPAIVEYLVSNYPHVISVDEEADDVIGYKHYAMYQNDPFSSIIASTDKDLDMIPGLHYNFVKLQKYYVSDTVADHNFYKQLLTGDSTDNIQGVPGIGPAKAAKLLADTKRTMYDIVREVYNNDEALLENARLLWIRRKENEIWEPPTNAVHHVVG